MSDPLLTRFLRHVQIDTQSDETSSTFPSTPGQQRALRESTEQAVRQGGIESPWSRLIGGLLLGSEAFAQALRRQTRGNAHEQTELRRLGPRVSWEEIVSAVEKVKGQKWEVFCQAYGDWGRDAALWLGRRPGRQTLAQLGKLAGGVDYAADSTMHCHKYRCDKH
jgi:hypothetical protein